MHQQPGDRSCSQEAIGGAHHGPVIVYMAKVSDAKTAAGSSASWFKVAEMGLVSNNPNYFGEEVLNVRLPPRLHHWTLIYVRSRVG
jgi:cellulase